MTKHRVTLENFLVVVLLLLMPSQLSYHLWPPSAFVFGIRVDYLSPTIYLTDIIFLTIFGLWLKNNSGLFIQYLKKHWAIIFIVALYIFANIIQSNYFPPTIFRWIKVIEMSLFAFYVFVRREYFNSTFIYRTLFVSVILFSIIGITQFIEGHTIGGLLYFLGERSFDTSTPGIALQNFFGRSVLRAYSTFPHPNALAGYLSVIIIYFATWYVNNKFFLKSVGLVVPVVALILSFSLSSILGLATCLLIFLLNQYKHFSNKKWGIVLLGIFLVSLISPLVFDLPFIRNVELYKSFNERVELSHIAGRLIGESPILGSGLNTFVVKESGFLTSAGYSWLLQPVHNIYLLVFSEAGIVGILLVYSLFYLLLVSKSKSSSSVKYALLFILISGMFDHYWFTLQQTNLLLAFIIGKSLSEPN